MRITGRTDKVWSHPYYEWERGGDISVVWDFGDEWSDRHKSPEESRANAEFIADRLAASGYSDITISSNQGDE